MPWDQAMNRTIQFSSASLSHSLPVLSLEATLAAAFPRRCWAGWGTKYRISFWRGSSPTNNMQTFWWTFHWRLVIDLRSSGPTKTPNSGIVCDWWTGRQFHNTARIVPAIKLLLTAVGADDLQFTSLSDECVSGHEAAIKPFSPVTAAPI